MNSTTEKWFRVDPVDAWFFRDGSPFNLGEDHVESTNLFPPPASTLSGAVRFSLAKNNGWNGVGSWAEVVDSTKIPLVEVLGNGPNDLGLLKFNGPFVAFEGSPLFPVPRHVAGVRTTESVENGISHRFRASDWFKPGEPLRCESGMKMLPVLSKRYADGEPIPEVADGFLLNIDGLRQVSLGKLPLDKHFVPLESLYSDELRVGIGRNKRTGAVLDGMLYNPRYIRPAPRVGLVVGLSGVPDQWSVPELIQLGGESRMAYLESIQAPAFNSSSDVSNGCVLIALTPALFAGTMNDGHGWWGAGPGDDARLLSTEFQGKVKTCLLDRPMKIGGWNTLARAPEPMHPYVRPGTTWYLDTTPTAETGLVSIGANTQHGYGLAMICRVPN